MSSATRQLKIRGFLSTESATATIAVNGVEVYSGQLAAGYVGPMEPSNLVDMAFFSYTGSTDIEENIEIDVFITSGAASIGSAYVNVQGDSSSDPDWQRPNGQVPDALDDGRTGILVNGQVPQWPSDGGPTLPRGTEESPGWFGWAFNASTGESVHFNYLCLPIISVTP